MECLGRYTFLVMTSVILSCGLNGFEGRHRAIRASRAEPPEFRLPRIPPPAAKFARTQGNPAFLMLTARFRVWRALRPHTGCIADMQDTLQGEKWGGIEGENGGPMSKHLGRPRARNSRAPQPKAKNLVELNPWGSFAAPPGASVGVKIALLGDSWAAQEAPGAPKSAKFSRPPAQSKKPG